MSNIIKFQRAIPTMTVGSDLIDFAKEGAPPAEREHAKRYMKLHPLECASCFVDAIMSGRIGFSEGERRLLMHLMEQATIREGDANA